MNCDNRSASITTTKSCQIQEIVDQSENQYAELCHPSQIFRFALQNLELFKQVNQSDHFAPGFQESCYEGSIFLTLFSIYILISILQFILFYIVCNFTPSTELRLLYQ